jgi:hypothetical protein
MADSAMLRLLGTNTSSHPPQSLNDEEAKREINDNIGVALNDTEV